MKRRNFLGGVLAGIATAVVGVGAVAQATTPDASLPGTDAHMPIPEPMQIIDLGPAEKPYFYRFADLPPLVRASYYANGYDLSEREERAMARMMAAPWYQECQDQLILSKLSNSIDNHDHHPGNAPFFTARLGDTTYYAHADGSICAETT